MKILLSALLLFLSLVLFIKYNMPVNEYVEAGLPKYGSFSKERKLFNPPVKLLDSDGDFFCSGFVIDDNYVVTAAHCLDNGGPRKNVKILAENNIETNTVANTVGFNHRMDYGLLKGNFKQFVPAAIDLSLDAPYTSSRLLVCGFPMGVKKMICYQVKAITNDMFGVAVGGFLFPGMSGGPAIDLDSNRVFGVNSRVSIGHVVVQPLVGLLATFGIEP